MLWTYYLEMQQSWRGGECKGTALKSTPDTLVAIHWSDPELIIY